MKYTHLFWDFDGTLYNSYPQMCAALMRMLDESGLPVPSGQEALSLLKHSVFYAVSHYAKAFDRDVQELLACVRLLLRRSGSEVRTDDAIACGDLRLDPGSFLLSCADRNVRLSRKEYDLMELLMRNFRIIVTKEQLLLKVWGYDSDAEDNNVEVYISFLRRKLTHLHSAVKIRTIRMVGYCLEVEE